MEEKCRLLRGAAVLGGGKERLEMHSYRCGNDWLVSSCTVTVLPALVAITFSTSALLSWLL